jgi:hypothetical protein
LFEIWQRTFDAGIKRRAERAAGYRINGDVP